MQTAKQNTIGLADLERRKIAQSVEITRIFNEAERRQCTPCLLYPLRSEKEMRQ